MGITKIFYSPGQPKSNVQVEVVNMTIKRTLKKKLEKKRPEVSLKESYGDCWVVKSYKVDGHNVLLMSCNSHDKLHG